MDPELLFSFSLDRGFVYLFPSQHKGVSQILKSFCWGQNVSAGGHLIFSFLFCPKRRSVIRRHQIVLDKPIMKKLRGADVCLWGMWRSETGWLRTVRWIGIRLQEKSSQDLREGHSHLVTWNSSGNAFSPALPTPCFILRPWASRAGSPSLCSSCFSLLLPFITLTLLGEAFAP